MRFANKVAIISGGGTGIGRELAAALVREGAKVVINGRRRDVLEQAATEIDASGRSIATFAGDIARPATAAGLVDVATRTYGGVDLLFNNAGVFRPKPFLEHTEEDYDQFLGIILKGKFFLAQAAAKAMQRRGGGAIVHTGSMWALQAVGATPSSAYSAANAGVHQLVKNLALELAPLKIRINAVAPAVVETPVYGTFLPADQVRGVLQSFDAFHPLGRIGQPRDVVGASLFLASDEAAWITGAVLPIDGGVMAGRN
jgi:NAD(P)-dependent dehydrogenase (short-subunit alcohol dehydrogenase family)